MNTDLQTIPATQLRWHEPAADEGSAFRALANTLLQRSGLVLGSFALALAAGVVYLLVAPPIYKIDALLQAEQRSGSLAAAVPQIAGAIEAPSNTLQGEIEILRSRDLVFKAIETVKADFDIQVKNRFPVVGQAWARRHEKNAQGVAPALLGLNAYAWGGEKLELEEFSIPSRELGTPFTLIANDRRWSLLDEFAQPVAQGAVGELVRFQLNGTPSQILVKSMQAAPGTQFTVTRHAPLEVYEDLMRRLKITEVSKQSGVVRVSIEDTDKDGASRLVNEMIGSYLARTVEKRTIEADLSLKFLEEQMPRVKRNMETAEEALSKFRTASSTLNVEQETIAGFQRSLQLENNRLDLELKQRQLSQRFEPSHPELQAVQSQLSAVTREIARLNGSVNRLPANQRDLVRLQRDVDTNSALYTALLNKVQELKVARAGMTTSATVVDSAKSSTQPLSPRPAVVMSVSAGIGLVLSFLAAFIAALVRPTVRDVETLEQQTGLPTVVSIPQSKRQNAVLARLGWLSGRRSEKPLSLRAPDEPAIESLRSFRTSLALAPSLPGGQRSKTVLITSPTSGAGKTFVSANISALLASVGKKVLLIEADMRRPSLHKYFGIRSSRGLADVLAQKATFDETVNYQVLPMLDILLPGRAQINPCDLLSSNAMPDLLAKVGRQYDFVIIDGTPILPVGDALAIMQTPVMTYLVTRSEHSTSREVQDAVRRIESVGGQVRALLFNGVKRGRLGAVRYDHYFGLERT
jgi:tyrosine-protein kinase Etk/Wzc